MPSASAATGTHKSCQRNGPTASRNSARREWHTTKRDQGGTTLERGDVLPEPERVGETDPPRHLSEGSFVELKESGPLDPSPRWLGPNIITRAHVCDDSFCLDGARARGPFVGLEPPVSPALLPMPERVGAS